MVTATIKPGAPRRAPVRRIEPPLAHDARARGPPPIDQSLNFRQRITVIGLPN